MRVDWMIARLTYSVCSFSIYSELAVYRPTDLQYAMDCYISIGLSEYAGFVRL